MAKKTLSETVKELNKTIKAKNIELATMRAALIRYADDDNWGHSNIVATKCCELGPDIAKEALDE